MKTYARVLAGVAALAMLVPAIYADDAALEQEAEQAVIGKVSDKIIAKFADFAGENTEALVEALSAGDSFKLCDPG